MVHIAVTSINPKIMRLFFLSFYRNEENREEEIANTHLHIFIDNRKYCYPDLYNSIERHRRELLPDLTVSYYTNLHDFLINYLDIKDKKSLSYIQHQTHHIKMAVPLIMKEHGVTKFFFTDDDVLFLRSPKTYFSKDFDHVVSVMKKEAFNLIKLDDQNSLNEFEALKSLVPNPLYENPRDQNYNKFKSVGQFLFNYRQDYDVFLEKFYSNDYILNRFFTKVFDYENEVFITNKKLQLLSLMNRRH